MVEPSEDFDLFRAVRSIQGSPHPSGPGMYCAFSAGRCHILAMALHSLTQSEIVVITPADDPNFLVHAAVHTNGIITDASGHMRSGIWKATWEHYQQGTPLDLRLSSPAELQQMMEQRPATESELWVARPFAEALVAATPVPLNAWGARLPFGATPIILNSPELEAHAAYGEALDNPALPIFVDIHFGPARNLSRDTPPHPLHTDSMAHEIHGVGGATRKHLQALGAAMMGTPSVGVVLPSRARLSPRTSSQDPDLPEVCA